MRNAKKLLPVLLVMAMLAALLSGCMYESIGAKIAEDGSGTMTMTVGYTEAAIEAMKENGADTTDIEALDKLEKDGVTYYVTTAEKTFASLEELNTLLNNPSADADDEDADMMQQAESMSNTTITIEKDEDGCFITTIKIKATDDEEDADTAADQADMSDEDLEKLTAGLVIEMSFEFPYDVKQTAGPATGVKIDGKTLILDCVALGEDAEEETVWTFDAHPAGAADKTDGGAKDVAPVVQISAQKLTVDGEEKNVEKYNIDGRNYFKLRDLAYMLDGTGSQFNVDFDKDANAVAITTGAAYTTPNGTEMEVGKDNSASAQRTAQTILVDGEEVATLTVYNIGNVNFFQLRELGETVGYDVDFDADTNTAIVTSK